MNIFRSEMYHDLPEKLKTAVCIESTRDTIEAVVSQTSRNSTKNNPKDFKVPTTKNNLKKHAEKEIKKQIYKQVVGLVDWFMVINATFNNISVISWRSVLLVEKTAVPGESHRPVASH